MLKWRVRVTCARVRPAGGRGVGRVTAALGAGLFGPVLATGGHLPPPPAAPRSGVTFQNFTDPSIDGPLGIVAGPDGALWFANFQSSTIDRVTTSGAFSTYTSTAVGHPRILVDGPDGAIWFVNYTNNSIGRITTGGTITSFTEPGCGPCGPFSITVGPDGALWFVNIGGGSSGAGSVGRVTTAGVFTIFNDPSISNPDSIAAGSDGALWFANTGNDTIDRITTSGKVTTYALASSPAGIVAGPDGALWVTTHGEGIVRMTTSGVITSYTSPSINAPYVIVVGPDGALWYVNNNGNSIGRITTTGTISAYTDPIIQNPYGLATGPDGDMWFTNDATNAIGRIVLPPPVRSVTVSPATTTFDSCKTAAGVSSGGVMTPPDGSCATSGGDDVTITNGPSFGHIDVAGADAVPADGGVHWNLCGGAGTACSGASGAPGVDQFSLSDTAGGHASPVLTGTPQCDTGFSADCSASAGQSATETLDLEGPATSTDNSGSFSMVLTWTAVP